MQDRNTLLDQLNNSIESEIKKVKEEYQHHLMIKETKWKEREQGLELVIQELRKENKNISVKNEDYEKRLKYQESVIRELREDRERLQGVVDQCSLMMDRVRTQKTLSSPKKMIVASPNHYSKRKHRETFL